MAGAPPARGVVVVMNGRAGALLDRADAEGELSRLFAEHGLTADFIAAGAGGLEARIRAAAAARPEMVVVAGGDGTVACAAAVLAETGIVLGILPSGTMNLLAKDLGLPIGDMASGIRVLAEGAPRAIDVAEVNGHVFLCASMLGLPARLGRHREAGRGGGWVILRWGRFAVAALRGIRAHVAPRLVLEMRGRAMRSRAASITVTVNALDDASGRMFGRARLDGGELAVHVIDRLGLADILRLAASLLRGRWREDGQVREFRATELVLRGGSRAIRVMNDGEGLLIASPLRYRVRPGALLVMAPRPDVA